MDSEHYFSVTRMMGFEEGVQRNSFEGHVGTLVSQAINERRRISQKDLEELKRHFFGTHTIIRGEEEYSAETSCCETIRTLQEQTRETERRENARIVARLRFHMRTLLSCLLLRPLPSQSVNTLRRGILFHLEDILLQLEKESPSPYNVTP